MTAETRLRKPVKDPIPLMLATFDGNDPRTWKPWDVTYGAAVAAYEASDASVPEDYVYEVTFRFRVALDSDKGLFAEGKNWSSYVGAVVDTSNPDVLDRHRRYLAELASLTTARYRTVGYYLFAIIDKTPSRTDYDTIGALTGQVRDRLKHEPTLNWIFHREALGMQLFTAAVTAVGRSILNRE